MFAIAIYGHLNKLSPSIQNGRQQIISDWNSVDQKLQADFHAITYGSQKWYEMRPWPGGRVLPAAVEWHCNQSARVHALSHIPCMSGGSNMTNPQDQDLDDYDDYEYGSEYSNSGAIWPAMKMMLKRQAILFRHNKYREKRNLSALIEDEEVNKSGITIRRF